MKSLGLTLFSALLLLTFYSCDNSDESKEVIVNSSLIKSLSVSVPNTNEMTFSVVLDATTDAEIAKYADKITKYEISELLFAVENYTSPIADEIYFNGDIGFGNKSQSQAVTSCLLSPYNITHVANTGDSPISTCNMKTNEIANILLEDNAIKIYMTGAFTKAPCSFDLKVTIKMKVTAVE